MGWAGGTEIFDCVASNLILIKHCDNHTVIDWQPIKLLLTELNRVLEDKDWDAQQESDYYDHPVIGKLLGNTFEEEDDE